MPDMHQRIKTKLEFALESPVLQLGEHGLEKDTLLYKIGDGKTRWNSLRYANAVEEAAPDMDYITVVEHGDDPDFPRPEGIAVAYWLGTVEPVNAIDDDLLSLEVDTP